MHPTASDFEKQFMQKVSGSSNSTKLSTNETRKPVNKKWFLLLGLILILIITLVIIISSQNTADPTEGPTPYTGNIVGLWGCNDGTDMNFSSGQTFLWENVTEIPVVEKGTFIREESTLKATTSSLTVADEPTSFQSTPVVFETYQEGDNILFVNRDTYTTRSCIKAEP